MKLVLCHQVIQEDAIGEQEEAYMKQPSRLSLCCALFPAILALLGLSALIPGCGSEKSSEPDTTAPATVSDLRIHSTGCDNVTLAWTAPGDDGTEGQASAYDLRYSTVTITEGTWASATQCASEPTPKAAGQTETYQVLSLAAGTPYYFALKARDGNGNESGLSNVRTSTPGSTVILWVNDGAAEDVDWTNNASGLSANWADAACAESYEYTIGTAPGGADLVTWTSTGALSHASHGGLTLVDGETYYFTARTRVGTTHGDSNSSDGVTVDLGAPTSQVNPLPAEEQTLVFTVTWDGTDLGSGIKHYDIQVSSDSGASWGSWLTATTLTSSEFTGINGHTYYFRSRAWDNAGNGEAYPDAPDAHTTVNLATELQVDWVHDGLASDVDWTTTAAELSANWPAVEGAWSYDYAIGMTPGGTEVVAWTSAGLETSATHGGFGLAEGQIYYFSVRVVVGLGHGAAVSSDGVRVDTGVPVSAVSALPGATPSEVFTVSWTGSDGVSGISTYDVQVKVDDGAWQDWLVGTVNSSSDYTGEIDHTYYFRSRAWDNAGNVEAYPTSADATTCVTCSYAYSLQWGSQGTGDGEFKYPFNVAVDAFGTVYVAESDNNRVQVFNSGGQFLRKWGGYGTGNGQFREPAGVAIDDSGYVYVADFFNDRVQKFASDSTFVTKWGTHGAGDSQFVYPRGIAVDDSSYVYVVDQGNNRIQKFTSQGAFVKAWGGLGSGDGKFNGALGVAVGPANTVYVVDAYNIRVQEFTSDGTFLNKWGSSGAGDGQFQNLSFIAVDADGYVYVTDSSRDRIQKFTSDGRFLTKWGSPGSGDGEFESAFGIAVSPDGSVYVTDLNNCRVQKFSATCP
jgi:hypothetical protein